MRAVRPAGNAALPPAQPARVSASNPAAARAARSVLMGMVCPLQRRLSGRVAIPARFERATPGLGILCSILLSYGIGAAQLTEIAAANKAPFGRLGRTAYWAVAPAVRGLPGV